MKTWLKNKLPPDVAKRALSINNNYKLRHITLVEQKRYVQSMATFVPTDSSEQLRARMQFHVHALEKGLSRQQKRLGFGRNALKALGETLCVYLEKGCDQNDADYQAALSVIHQYIVLHKQENYNIEYLSEYFTPEVLMEVRHVTTITGGVKTVLAKDKQHTAQMSFKDLAAQRVSMREYSAEAVNSKEVFDAIKMALQTPSVCNRQPARVYLIKQSELIRSILEVQGGFGGYDLPPVLLLVTVDNRAFLSIHERNEGYIDGGLFSMSLLYALEAKQLAACALNAMLSDQAEKQIRNKLAIGDTENLIMFVAVGHFPEESNVPLSRRKSLEEIVRTI